MGQEEYFLGGVELGQGLCIMCLVKILLLGLLLG